MKATELLARRAKDRTRSVALEDGVTVTVRGLTKGEVESANELKDDQRDRLIMKLGMVDPTMTVTQVREYLLNAPAGDSVKILGAIADLSGLLSDARKSGVQPVGE